MRKITTLLAILIIIVIGTAIVLSQSNSATTGNAATPATLNVSPNSLSSVKTITNKDINIRQIEIIDDQITIDYRESTKILGLIPAKFNLHIVTDAAEKQVKLMRPWWTIFGNTRVGQLLQDIKNNLNSADLSNLSSRDIRIIQTISNTLRK